MWFHDGVVIVDLAATLAQITDQFLAAIELGARGLIAIEIADQANAKRDVVQVITVHVAAVDLPAPAIAYFDFAVAGGGAVADDEMIGETVSHPANISMVIIENGRVPLSCAAVVHDNELPAGTRDGRAVDRRLDRAAQIAITAAAPATPDTK